MIMNNKKLTYRQYKLRQRIAAFALLAAVAFFIILGIVLAKTGEDESASSIDSESECCDIQTYLDDNDTNHSCSEHPHQTYEEVISYPDGSVEVAYSSTQGVSKAVECSYELAEEGVLTPYIDLSETEKRDLAALIYLEGRGESVECQAAIGSVVLNRYTTSKSSSLNDIIYAEGQFTPAYLIDETIPTETQIAIVEELCLHGPTVPEYVTFFRSNHYFNWSTVSNYMCIDNTYFSINNKLKEELSLE